MSKLNGITGENNEGIFFEEEVCPDGKSLIVIIPEGAIIDFGIIADVYSENNKIIINIKERGNEK